MSKISILGAGKVGKAVALNLMRAPMNDLDIVLYDRIKPHVEAFIKDRHRFRILMNFLTTAMT